MKTLLLLFLLAGAATAHAPRTANISPKIMQHVAIPEVARIDRQTQRELSWIKPFFKTNADGSFTLKKKIMLFIGSKK